MKSEPLYLLDTNVIYDMLTMLTEKPSGIGRSIDKFLSVTNKKVYISDLVWTEFSISWFQKNISFPDYELWYSRKLASYAQVYQQLLRRNVELLPILKLSAGGYAGVVDLARDLAIVKYDDSFIREVQKNFDRKLENALREEPTEKNRQAHHEYVERLQKNYYNGKLLDGLDSMILASSILFAQENPKSTVTLVSNDRWMGTAANHLMLNAASYSLKNLTKRPFTLKIKTPAELGR